ncbi:MAG: hypothetical protein ACRC3Z_06655 [Phocaeicola sp.]
MEVVASLFSKTMNKVAIEAIAKQVVNEPRLFDSLYALTLHPQTEVAWRALWTCQWVCEQNSSLLLEKQSELIERVLATNDQTQKRLFLRILWMLPVPHPLPVHLLDYCLEGMSDPKTAVAAQALCMKVAYKLCLEEPELLEELRLCLEAMEPAYYTGAVIATRKELLKKIRKGKRL